MRGVSRSNCAVTPCGLTTTGDEGYHHLSCIAPSNFAAFLRYLPRKEKGTPLRLIVAGVSC